MAVWEIPWALVDRLINRSPNILTVLLDLYFSSFTQEKLNYNVGVLKKQLEQVSKLPFILPLAHISPSICELMNRSVNRPRFQIPWPSHFTWYSRFHVITSLYPLSPLLSCAVHKCFVTRVGIGSFSFISSTRSVIFCDKNPVLVGFNG